MFAKMRLKNVILLSLLIVGVIPTAVIGLLALQYSRAELRENTFSQLESLRDVKKHQIESYFKERRGDMGVLVETVKTLRSQAFNKLISVREIKKRQIDQYVNTMLLDMEVFARSQDVAALYEKLFKYHEVTDTEADGPYNVSTPEYKQIWEQHGRNIFEYARDSGVHDAYMVCAAHGHVMYSSAKEADLGTTLRYGLYKDSGLARLWRKVTEVDGRAVVDFEPYAPSNGKPAAFAGVAIRDEGGKMLGMMALQLQLDQINDIMTTRDGRGETGEIYLVGPDQLMRSDSHLDPEHHSAVASFKDPSKGRVNTKASKAALAGTTGIDAITNYNGDFVLSAWAPVEIGDITWGLVAEINVAEAFAPKVEDAERDFFTQYKEQYGCYDLFLINSDGYCFYSVQRESEYQTNLVNGRYKDSNLGELARTVLKTGQSGFADFEPYAPSNDEPAAFIAQPVVEDGEVKVIVAVQLSIDDINGVMGLRTGLGKTGETYLVGPDNRMRSDSYTDSTGRSVVASFAGSVLRNGCDTDACRAALAGQAGIKVVANYNGNPVLSGYAPVKVADVTWALLAEKDEQEAFAAVHSLTWLIGFIILVTVFAVTLLAMCIARSVTQRLAVETKQLMSASSQLKSAAQQQLSSASEQCAAAGQVSTAMKELTATAEQIVERAQQVTSATDTAVNRCTEGTDSVNQAQAVMQEIREHIEKVVQHMLDLNAKSQEINMATDIITELSEQTTILSYNAAIEAAAAGEAGQSFAVVAEQVGKLADRAKEAAREVRHLIDQVQKDTNTTVMATEAGLRAADRGLEAQDEASQTMVTVADGIRSSLDAAREIELSSKQQSGAATQVLEGMDNVMTAARQSEASSKQTLNTADQLVKTANTLEDI